MAKKKRTYKKIPKWGISHLIFFVSEHWEKYESIPLKFHLRDSGGNGRTFHYDEFKEHLTLENFAYALFYRFTEDEILLMSGKQGEKAREERVADSFKMTITGKDVTDIDTIYRAISNLHRGELRGVVKFKANSYKNEKEIGVPFKNDIFGHDENAGLLERQFGLSPIDNISNSEANR